MIRKIKFKNFYSFKNENEISFLTTGERDYSYHKAVDGKYITKIASIIGANASGKTNIIRLIGFIAYFIGRENEEGNVTLVKGFFDNTGPVEIEIEFEVEERIFLYLLEIQKGEIRKEILTEKVEEREDQLIFKRVGNEIEVQSEEIIKKLDFTEKEKLKYIKGNISLIKFLEEKYEIKIISKIYKYFKNYGININEQGRLTKDRFEHQSAVVRFYHENMKIKEEMEEFIRNFDLGLDDFLIEEVRTEGENGKKDTSYKVWGRHGSKKIPLLYESQGTRALFFLLADILMSIKKNKIIAIDEIDNALHPWALYELIKFIINESENNQSQFIFSSQMLEFMHELEMHQIFLIEKNDKGESSVKRLNKVAGVRSDENFVKKYMAGKYGAIPKIKA